MNKNTFLEFLDFVQNVQKLALNAEHIEKFDVSVKPGRISIWISIRKDRSSSSYFYDVVREIDSDDKIEDVRKQIRDRTSSII